MLVLSIRKKLPDEQATHLVDVDYERNGKKIRGYLLLAENRDGTYSVTGGDAISLDLHYIDAKVSLAPISRLGYSHQIIGHD
jgi:hypothetical protein